MCYHFTINRIYTLDLIVNSREFKKYIKLHWYTKFYVQTSYINSLIWKITVYNLTVLYIDRLHSTWHHTWSRSTKSSVSRHGVVLDLLICQLFGQTINFGLELIFQTEELCVTMMNWVLGSHPWVPSTVVSLPELHVPIIFWFQEDRKCVFLLPDWRWRKQGLLIIKRSTIHWIQEHWSSTENESPQRLSSKKFTC